MAGARVVVVGLAVAAVLGCASCARVVEKPIVDPAIPTITVPTTTTRVPVMVDRPLPDDCELVVPADVLNERIGRDLGGSTVQIIGIPEPGVGRTAKLDCYYGVGENKGIATAPIVIGLSTYADDAAATTRVTESLDAYRGDGASVSEVEVGKQKAALVLAKDENLVVGSLGKSTFVARAKKDAVPEDQVKAVLTALAARSMTPEEG
ncbi:hypothetical protein [Actinosynnema sp.]|uniref:hypothetical protein n=1 Tax=Actinosynnema sp. TaxID=1872144 RepID=UPI003F845C6B